MKHIRPYNFRNELLADLSTNFDRLLSSFNNIPELGTSEISKTNWIPKIDIKEHDNYYIVYADVPGIDPSAIDVSVDNGVLTIKGHKESEKKEEKENYLHVERSSGSFMRQMTLPESVDSSKVKAKSKNGVLEITLPKAEKSTTRKIAVEKWFGATSGTVKCNEQLNFQSVWYLEWPFIIFKIYNSQFINFLGKSGFIV